jgi:lipopolysaccharide export system permease protein
VRDGNLVINIAERSSAVEFGGIMIFELSPDNRLLSVAHADRANSGPGKTWELGSYAESRFSGDSVSDQQRGAARAAHGGQRHLPADGGGAAVGDGAGRAPAGDALPARQPPGLPAVRAGVLVRAGAERVAIPLGVLFALPFGFGNMRSAGSGARSTLGLAIALVYFFLQRTVESGTVAFSLNPLLLAWVPTLLLATATGVLLVRTR